MNQWVYFWITFFLGFFGVHKFVRGEIGIGILYIFTGGLFGIGWLYDCITALSAAIKADARMRAVAEADAAAQARAAEQVERARADEDARKRRREIRAQAFGDSVEAIPRVLVGTDGEKTAVRSLNTLDPHYSTITVRSKLPVLSNFISVDIETCGLRVTMPILEVTAIKFADFKPVAAFTTLINPGKAIPEDATRINGITDEMVKGAPSIWQIMPSLNAFVDGMPIVGHNLPFDLAFLYRRGFDVQAGQKLFDTLALAKRVVPYKDVENYKLGTLCQYYGIDYFGAHRSLADAYVTGQLFHALVEERTSRD